MNNESFRVLLLADSVTFHAERFAEELQRQGCRVLTASLEAGQMKHERLRRRGPFKSLHYLLAVKQIKKLAAEFRPHVINAHYASGYGFIAVLGASGIPVVVNLWGSDILIVPRKSFLHRWKTVHALRRAACVIGDSHYLVREAARLTPLSRTCVIPWGIEQRFTGLHRVDYNFGRPLRIIVPRAHEEVYDNLFVVKALAPLVNDGVVELTFPNWGSLRDSFREVSASLVGTGLNFYDKLTRPEFLKLMAGHDVYLSASRSDSSPVTLIEAMALGLLPIAADIDGVREWLNADTGFLFQPADAAELRNLITRIILEGEPYAAMRCGNLERVKREALFEQNLAEQITIMKELAGIS